LTAKKRQDHIAVAKLAFKITNLLFIYKTKTKETGSIYQELAEKEQALLMAAQFGQNLIEEKEELERQIESMKREHQNQLEVSFYLNFLTLTF